jgi:hypothetical protein
MICIKCDDRDSYQYLICDSCYDKSNKSGNKVVNDFIRYTQVQPKKSNKFSFSFMEFVPYDMFKDIKFFAEGGFSKVYKATWTDGPMVIYRDGSKWKYKRHGTTTVALKELHNSKNINSKELNEVRFILC